MCLSSLWVQKQTISELNVDAAEAKDKFQAEQRTAAVAAAEAAAKAEQELIKLRAAGEQQIADLSAEATAAVERSEEVALHQRRNAEQTKLVGVAFLCMCTHPCSLVPRLRH